jgi:hypothetical protein
MIEPSRHAQQDPRRAAGQAFRVLEEVRGAAADAGGVHVDHREEDPARDEGDHGAPAEPPQHAGNQEGIDRFFRRVVQGGLQLELMKLKK